MDELCLETNAKIKLIEDFIALSLRRNKVADEAFKIMKEVEKVRELMVMVSAAMQSELASVKLEFQTTSKRIRQLQCVILDHVIKERRRKLIESAEENKNVQFASSVTKHPNGTILKDSAYGGTLAQEMKGMHLYPLTPNATTMSNHKGSPLVKRCRINPVPFVYLDFDYHVSSEQFDKIPKYMKGRETVEELNTFLETVIIWCFNQKYQLLHRQRNTLRNRHDLELWKLYNGQVSYVPGRNFITIGDISRHMNKMLDKKQQNRIVMLRHVGVLQEQRVSQIVCYIWNADKVMDR